MCAAAAEFVQLGVVNVVRHNSVCFGSFTSSRSSDEIVPGTCVVFVVEESSIPYRYLARWYIYSDSRHTTGRRWVVSLPPSPERNPLRMQGAHPGPSAVIFF